MRITPSVIIQGAAVAKAAPTIKIRAVKELSDTSKCIYMTFPSFLTVKVIGFFSQRLEQAGSDLSVERVQEVIMKGAQALPTDRLKVTHSRSLSRTCTRRVQTCEIMKRESS